jgi:DNA-binding transcriptional regulator YhcF (GntR family)
MLTPLLNKQLKTPLYIQLYEYIKKEIEAGGIPAGALLPHPLFMRHIASKQKYS